jgi:hypothetical protein
MLYRILTRLGFCRRSRCHCGALALTYDESRGYCGPHTPLQ